MDSMSDEQQDEMIRGQLAIQIFLYAFGAALFTLVLLGLVDLINAVIFYHCRLALDRDTRIPQTLLPESHDNAFSSTQTLLRLSDCVW